ncbi:hypothetical protein CY34DRAFT_107574 [Suillus luteus UH-Slu-Lm8-n1]|uniref:Uncharacterized protein n=1 Tax=Suillus luteus UH-Slu-Lm8-n1 TaxID=930992 RepID=A0A0D0AS01_9AGAM|nr:hypothetical protein CY34DRAFT_107574 [Suillus luteus UH-Slu-Lm8-n1]
MKSFMQLAAQRLLSKFCPLLGYILLLRPINLLGPNIGLAIARYVVYRNKAQEFIIGERKRWKEKGCEGQYQAIWTSVAKRSTEGERSGNNFATEHFFFVSYCWRGMFPLLAVFEHERLYAGKNHFWALEGELGELA